MSFFAALASAYQVEHPSEYVYESDSVTRNEEGEANCRRYPPTNGDGGIHYTHCDGTHLKLTDSDLGSEQYSSSDYYLWTARTSAHQLLFIFPTRVNLTTITLHYYSDNIRGLANLRFYAVPNDFDVWDAPVTSYGFEDITPVPPGGEPQGLRSVSINFNYTTTKVLMYRSRSDFQFAVSEVEFFLTTVCNGKLCTSIIIIHYQI